MRSLLVALVLAGCTAPVEPIDAPEAVALPALRDVSLTPAPWPTHPCTDAEATAPAPLLPPFDTTAEQAVLAIARGLGIDLRDATAGATQDRLGADTGWEVAIENLTIHVNLPDHAPAAIVVEWDHHAWPGRTPTEADAAGARLLEAIDPGDHLTWYTYHDQRDYSVSSDNGTDGYVTGWWYDFRGYPQSTLWVYPLQDISAPPKVNETTARSAAARFLACAAPSATLVDDQGGYPLQVARHGTHVWSFMAQAADPAHHCGGQAWFVLVDTQSGDALGIEDRLCY